MAHPETQDSSMRALQVCSHCKSIKKGCDKRLPSCSQCIKRRAVCRYGEPDKARRSRSENGSPQGRHERLAPTWASIPRSLRARFSPSARLSLLLMNSLSDIFPANALESNIPEAFTNNDNIFDAQVLYVIGLDERKPEDVVARYFRGVHQWLPIISRRRFRDRLTHFQASPASDFSVLLLAMRLITQHPSTDPELDQDREVLYLATKSLFAQVQAFIPSSLFLVQAGVILGHYEHAHGMIEASYITVGTCGRMACAIGMHTRQCSAEMQGSDAWFEDEEVLCTWWALMILDRTIGSDPQMRGRPLATRAIREDDYLPLESYHLDRDAEDLLEPTFRYFVSTTSLPGVGTFGREAQATYLFDRVRLSIERGESAAYKLYHIGRDLQNLLAVVMEQAAGKWGLYCGAMQMLITGLYNLHQAVHIHTDDSHQAHRQDTIEVALNTLTRMVIDIVYAFNREVGNFDIEVLYPAMMHIVRCAQQHILTAEDFSDPLWLEDFDQLRKTLSYFNRRWVLAGMELHRLNETVEMSMALRI